MIFGYDSKVLDPKMDQPLLGSLNDLFQTLILFFTERRTNPGQLLVRGWQCPGAQKALLEIEIEARNGAIEDLVMITLLRFCCCLVIFERLRQQFWSPKKNGRDWIPQHLGFSSQKVECSSQVFPSTRVKGTCTDQCTLPETNRSPMKIDGWKMKFQFAMSYFQELC